MGYIRARKCKNGRTRYQAEIRLKGYKIKTESFDRRTDATPWIQKLESDLRAGRHQLYSESERHTLKEAIDR